MAMSSMTSTSGLRCPSLTTVPAGVASLGSTCARLSPSRWPRKRSLSS
uniref:Alternative protein AEN n=1 Tax=Homo sapiens TaxID=9606 RepID=L8EB49_HUMAN|nr:alternative protein AEN [Homo sapiens]